MTTADLLRRPASFMLLEPPDKLFLGKALTLHHQVSRPESFRQISHSQWPGSWGECRFSPVSGFSHLRCGCYLRGNCARVVSVIVCAGATSSAGVYVTPWCALNLEPTSGEVMMMNEELKVAPIDGCNSNKRASITVDAQHAAAAILGIVLVLTPLALWVAWSEQALLLVMASGIAAMIGLLLCHWLTDDNRYAAHSGSERSPQVGPTTVSDEFLAELSSMGPLYITIGSRGTTSSRRKRRVCGSCSSQTRQSRHSPHPQ